LLKQRPLRLDAREVLFALVFFPAWFQQAMLAPDPLHGHVAEGQIEFASEPRGAKGGQLLAQSKDLLFDFRRSFQRVTMRSAAVFFQTAGTVLLIAPPPLTDRKPASSEQPCGGFNTAFFDRLDQAKPMVVSVFISRTRSK